ncbi:CDP-alcohol phosphatidyltransferase family protein [Cellulomonas hominis]|uniref:Phosphatidylinositol phosphate synthase n=2 Tax=Cellulomonas hominis TaxID=156981 RepID=A0A511F8V0_9CELL|nr:CDP-alcohol phosphatidyltransferase family protein [Cellulomonas hominis]MBU5424431.1 CDP-alcohol phosphatidyltransferase family protein [Cellulomonas hominis]NKY06523.1 CDP-alcohol phosphatidyltransferase family protein [Cellulomonas hominis]NKY09650.1 CDP-alcohol phosphatidyltransferase family protein [Cellulomonas hominis]GEL44984.1 CDP-alcohol phosphatidyltransferase [Cellulomonas hominis]
MLNRLRGAMTRLFTPVADALLKRGVSPDAVTITGTVAVVATALWLYPTGHFLAASLVIAFFALTDSLDGVMARRAGRSGPWGAFLDSTLDRFGDAAIFSGLVLWFMGEGDSAWGAGAALACLVLGSIVPYARARAEGLGMTAAVGIAERADRLATVLVATALVGLGVPQVVLVVVLALLAVASLVTIVQRMATVRRQAGAAA